MKNCHFTYPYYKYNHQKLWNLVLFQQNGSTLFGKKFGKVLPPPNFFRKVLSPSCIWSKYCFSFSVLIIGTIPFYPGFPIQAITW